MLFAPARPGALFLLSMTMVAGYTPAPLPVVNANDNRSPAGILRRDTLQIRLVVKMARWYPEEAGGPFIEAPVFSEEGKAPSIPGPLIRVPSGTTIVATIKTELADSTLWVHGLISRPANADDSTSIQPGSAHTFTFAAGAPGTYFYYAKAGTLDWGIREREQLSGAFIVDAPGARNDDRILMINIWGEPLDSQTYDDGLAINGKSWPHTERYRVDVGDTLRWRVINASKRSHPMHLHGFYYRVDSKGSFLADSVVPPEKREHVVTRHMVAGSTMNITWSPKIADAQAAAAAATTTYGDEDGVAALYSEYMNSVLNLNWRDLWLNKITPEDFVSKMVSQSKDYWAAHPQATQAS